VQVSLTPAGAALLGRYQAIIDARLLTLLGPLPVADRARLLAALQDLATVLAPPGSGDCAGERRCEKTDS